MAGLDPAHVDRVERDFTDEAPSRLWLADITEHPAGEDKLCLCERSSTSTPTGASGTPSTGHERSLTSASRVFQSPGR